MNQQFVKFTKFCRRQRAEAYNKTRRCMAISLTVTGFELGCDESDFTSISYIIREAEASFTNQKFDLLRERRTDGINVKKLLKIMAMLNLLVVLILLGSSIKRQELLENNFPQGKLRVTRFDQYENHRLIFIMNQYPHSFSLILKQKHRSLIHQLRLKSITVDARRTLVLSLSVKLGKVETTILNILQLQLNMPRIHLLKETRQMTLESSLRFVSEKMSC
ncbi:unnamed protein product [Paramecium octaurelia]|uniref:Uncharacterized protein n=1 Tax=Paramecium octaurelia TaxID=43137 RepID=A0A8S1VQA9_PAROT|nr:unnamed protein product [Paramecium octaurelia]CAD8179381.1 unnamed protein product [Paramecium octaurelia]